MKRLPPLASPLSSLLFLALACGGGDGPGEAHGEAASAVADAPKVEEGATKFDVSATPEAATPAVVAPSDPTAGDPAAVPGDPSAAAGSQGGTEGAAPADPITPLLDSVRNKKTKDEAALAALEEAKAAGAEAKDLATAANARGEKLGGDVERATIFFEWAAAADPKFPNATFNLAKIAANAGEVDRAKELLIEVKARGGKRLLKNVGFDPTFSLLADDPEVLALAK